MPVGYSGKPLATKLGLKSGLKAWFYDMPENVRAEIDSPGLAFQDEPQGAQAVHIFVTAKADAERLLIELRQAIHPDGFVWISWPKKAAKVPTDVTEDVIRAIARPLGFVDLKVCAVDEVWSGLKLMIRKELR